MSSRVTNCWTERIPFSFQKVNGADFLCVWPQIKRWCLQTYRNHNRRYISGVAQELAGIEDASFCHACLLGFFIVQGWAVGCTLCNLASKCRRVDKWLNGWTRGCAESSWHLAFCGESCHLWLSQPSSQLPSNSVQSNKPVEFAVVLFSCGETSSPRLHGQNMHCFWNNLSQNQASRTLQVLVKVLNFARMSSFVNFCFNTSNKRKNKRTPSTWSSSVPSSTQFRPTARTTRTDVRLVSVQVGDLKHQLK